MLDEKFFRSENFSIIGHRPLGQTLGQRTANKKQTRWNATSYRMTASSMYGDNSINGKYSYGYSENRSVGRANENEKSTTVRVFSHQKSSCFNSCQRLSLCNARNTFIYIILLIFCCTIIHKC